MKTFNMPQRAAHPESVQPSSRSSVRLRAVFVVVLITAVMWFSGGPRSLGQIPAIPPEAQPVADALAAAPPGGAAQSVTINTAKGCCKPSIWDFLGVDQICKGVGGVVAGIRSLPLVHGLGSTVIHPGLQAAGLLPPGVATAMPGVPPPPGVAAGPGAPPPGAPPGGPGIAAPGVPGMPPPAPGPIEVAMKIEADKAKAKATIQAIRRLAKQDCLCYPEIVTALLGELDSCFEEVRHEALKALAGSCRQGFCTPCEKGWNAPGGRQDCAQCGHGDDACQRVCTRCGCQPIVIERVSALLLARDAFGNPLEKSDRVRRLAIQILEDCLCRMPPEIRSAPQQAQPDPDLAELAAEANRAVRTEPALTGQPAVAAPEPPPTSGRQARAALADDVERSVANNRQQFHQLLSGLAGEILEKGTESNDGAIMQAADNPQAGQPRTSADMIREIARVFSEPTPRTTSILELEQRRHQKHNQVAALALQIIAETHNDPQREYDFTIAFLFLTNARLELALMGDRASGQALYEDAATLYERAPEGHPAAEAAFTVLRFSQANANLYGHEQPHWLQHYARQARQYPAVFPKKADRAVPYLMTAAQMCELHGLENDARSCYVMLEQEFADDDQVAALLAERRVRVMRDRQIRPIGHVEIKPQSLNRSTSDAGTGGGVVHTDGAIETGADSKTIQQIQGQPLPLPPLPSPATEMQPTPVPQSPVPDPLPGEPAVELPLSEVDGVFAQRGLPQETWELAMQAISASRELQAVQGEDSGRSSYSYPYSNIGSERAAVAVFQMTPARPQNLFQIRFDSAKQYNLPDRAEYFWPRTGKGGPKLAETATDFQELHIYNESGSDKVTAFIDIPFRFVVPEINDNSAGLSDIVAGVKSLMVDEEAVQISTIFGTSLPTGVGRRGLGRGHLTLQPGVLGTYRLGCNTYLHGQIQGLIPLAADGQYSGPALTWGVGASQVLFARPWHSGEWDDFAVLGSLELVSTSLLDGMETVPGIGARPVDFTAVTIHPGLRFMFGERIELGVSGGLPLGKPQLYDNLLRLQFSVYH